MDEVLAQIVGDAMIDAGKEMKAGNCHLTDDQAMHIFETVAHKEMSREEACDFVNMNSNKFADHITLNKLPKGRKRRGFKELVWYKDELYKALVKLRNKK